MLMVQAGLLSEFTRLNHACEIPRSCRDNLHITKHVLTGPEAFDLLFFDRSQEFVLDCLYLTFHLLPTMTAILIDKLSVQE